jgi:hypothetical protein
MFEQYRDVSEPTKSSAAARHPHPYPMIVKASKTERQSVYFFDVHQKSYGFYSTEETSSFRISSRSCSISLRNSAAMASSLTSRPTAASSSSAVGAEVLAVLGESVEGWSEDCAILTGRLKSH